MSAPPSIRAATVQHDRRPTRRPSGRRPAPAPGRARRTGRPAPSGAPAARSWRRAGRRAPAGRSARAARVDGELGREHADGAVAEREHAERERRRRTSGSSGRREVSADRHRGQAVPEQGGGRGPRRRRRARRPAPRAMQQRRDAWRPARSRPRRRRRRIRGCDRSVPRAGRWPGRPARPAARRPTGRRRGGRARQPASATSAPAKRQTLAARDRQGDVEQLAERPDRRAPAARRRARRARRDGRGAQPGQQAGAAATSATATMRIAFGCRLRTCHLLSVERMWSWDRSSVRACGTVRHLIGTRPFGLTPTPPVGAADTPVRSNPSCSPAYRPGPARRWNGGAASSEAATGDIS